MKHLYVISPLRPFMKRFKVGIAEDPISRIRQLQTGNPEPLAFGLCQLLEHAGIVERSIHALLQPYRLEGEWLEPPAEAMEAVKYILWELDKDCVCNACNGSYTRKVYERNVRKGASNEPW